MPKGNGKCTTVLLFYDLFFIQQKCLKLHIYTNAVVKCHWATVCKTVRPMLSDRCLYCLSVCRSVTVYYGETVGWINMSVGTEVGLAPGHIVLDGDPAPPPRKGLSSPHFLAHVCCGQTVADLGNC